MQQMIIPAFNANALKKRLLSLDSKKRLLFGALCCERLIRNYIPFHEQASWGDVNILEVSLESMWSFLSGNSLDTSKVKKLLDDCIQITPDSDEFEHPLLSVAQDACFAICNLLDYVLTGDTDNILHIATYATDSVDFYIHFVEKVDISNPDREKIILKHPLMQRELAQQENSLRAIENSESSDSELAIHLRHFWDNDGKSNLNL